MRSTTVVLCWLVLLAMVHEGQAGGGRPPALEACLSACGFCTSPWPNENCACQVGCHCGLGVGAEAQSCAKFCADTSGGGPFPELSMIQWYQLTSSVANLHTWSGGSVSSGSCIASRGGSFQHQCANYHLGGPTAVARCLDGCVSIGICGTATEYGGPATAGPTNLEILGATGAIGFGETAGAMDAKISRKAPYELLVEADITVQGRVASRVPSFSAQFLGREYGSHFLNGIFFNQLRLLSVLHGDYDTSTGTWTVPETGFYQVNALVLGEIYSAADAMGTCRVAVIVNELGGTANEVFKILAMSQQTPKVVSVVAPTSWSISTLEYLKAGQELMLGFQGASCYNSFKAPATFSQHPNNEPGSKFSAYMVGLANHELV